MAQHCTPTEGSVGVMQRNEVSGRWECLEQAPQAWEHMAKKRHYTFHARRSCSQFSTEVWKSWFCNPSQQSKDCLSWSYHSLTSFHACSGEQTFLHLLWWDLPFDVHLLQQGQVPVTLRCNLLHREVLQACPPGSAYSSSAAPLLQTSPGAAQGIHCTGALPGNLGTFLSKK